MSQVNQTGKLTADEIALYDRQIRLWGLAAQANMRSAKVLLINIGSIGTEISKNIVLSGIGNLCVLDNHIVREEDLGCQFFLEKKDVGKLKVDVCSPKIKDLNPRVNLTVDSDSLANKDELFFKQFDLIVATELRKDQITELNRISRKLNISLYVTGSNGLFSYIFVDLIEFVSEEEKLKTGRTTLTGEISSNRTIIEVDTRVDDDDPKKIFETIKTRNSYKPFDDMLQTATLEGKLTKRQVKRVNSIVPLTISYLTKIPSSVEELHKNTLSTCDKLGIQSSTLKDEYIQQFYKQANVEFAPVAAIIGGAVAQDVINILGKRQSPLNNFIVFDGITLEMPIYEL
ncbi:similar to Saccharomyces cerevisiae YPR180W AOS1 Subunit of a heterodimeric nuclear SUMO activating enzyme (E1) with Uba2p [Maudiozyma barnettii]|mgnify:CR=1 FL=1|uniref:Similar to Saccharomyces cerevisiae YPR180W AOS1 Subunit of a heterodimeric nuclear SUMO activating enzyme (E1) with Uba2p n=1 Tax=Maudiozyma barnettii TaxID=61262 RepID=A0A8H2ZGQ2_9SACH|nr:E1 ubiquitin-activating protein AOS1 [Kazachstania barnettii]CAB4253913.1 similar to Saccharomyces cerevisiae YPR180W AOS1 Subunit of a heterodimeric nuclear SUMO activating enzyme (E1) with Uba2p [Kazachstania barnettii]CAD1781663.1 similar to Saccharomyces cerevisiae YPR180W AOS1 Subunit of a heterodimeric nuclear SUMO activating enzyme (E1) with Uba2p [Kazachstania barnettii]